MLLIAPARDTGRPRRGVLSRGRRLRPDGVRARRHGASDASLRAHHGWTPDGRAQSPL